MEKRGRRDSAILEFCCHARSATGVGGSVKARFAFRKSTQRQLCVVLVREEPLFVVVGDEGRGSDSRLERNTVAARNFEELQLSDSATAVKLVCTNTVYCRSHMAPGDNYRHKKVFISSCCSDNAVVPKASFVRTSF